MCHLSPYGRELGKGETMKCIIHDDAEINLGSIYRIPTISFLRIGAGGDPENLGFAEFNKLHPNAIS